MTEGPLLPHDLGLLARISTGNAWLRSLLCTLARRGTRLRIREPDRAAEVIRLLAPWPWFKGGQFLFDLLEWEDFMVDGPPPPALTDVLEPEHWARLDDLVKRARGLVAAVDMSAPAGVPLPPAGLTVEALVDHRASDEDLPPLEPGLHLYRDVVLGVWASTTDSPGGGVSPGTR